MDHAGLLSEVCLLGNVALRAQKKLAWDGPSFCITNDPPANQFLQREYRPGWTPADDKLLGARPDAQVALFLGLSRLAVNRRRQRLGIPAPR